MDLKSCQSHLTSEMTVKEVIEYYFSNYNLYNNDRRIITDLNKRILKDIEYITYLKVKGELRSTLLGVPFCISKSIIAKGFSPDAGTNISVLEAQESSYAVKLLKKRGMILFGVANTNSVSKLTGLTEGYLESNIDNISVCGTQNAVLSDICPIALDIEHDGNVLNINNDKLCSIKLSSDFLKKNDFIKTSKDSSLGIIGNDYMDLIYIMQALKPEGNYFSYLSGYFDPIKVAVSEGLENLFNSALLNVKVDSKVTISEYTYIPELVNELLGTTLSINALDVNLFNLKLNDIYVTDKYESYMSYMSNPCVSIMYKNRRIFVIAKNGREDMLIKFLTKIL